MKLKVTKIEAPGRFDNPSLPIVHFSGSSRSLDALWDPNANSRIRGPFHPIHPPDQAMLTDITQAVSG